MCALCCVVFCVCVFLSYTCVWFSFNFHSFILLCNLLLQVLSWHINLKNETAIIIFIIVVFTIIVLVIAIVNVIVVVLVLVVTTVNVVTVLIKVLLLFLLL